MAGFGRRSFWVAVTGLALVIAVVVGSSLMLEVGFQPMRERNALAAQGVLPPAPLPADPTGSRSVTGVGTPPSLELKSDESLVARDGCNSYEGTWRQESDGTIRLQLSPNTGDMCDGVDIWLSHAAAAIEIDGRLVVSGEGGTAIGVLEADR